MPSIFTKLGALFGKKTPPDVPEPASAVGYHGPSSPNITVPWIRPEQRRKLEKDLEDMDLQDGVISRAIDTFVDCATSFQDDVNPLGFKIDMYVKPGTKPTSAQIKSIDVLNDLVDRAELNGLNCWETTRGVILKGDIFSELIYSDDYHIQKVVGFPKSWQINENRDNSGNLKTGDPAVAMRDPKQEDSAAYTQINEINKVIAAFWPHQIVHWMFGARAFGTYAHPMLGSAIRDWKRLRAQEDALAMARITRAWDTDVHSVPMPMEVTDEERNKRLRDYRDIAEKDQLTTYDSASIGFQSTNRYSPMNVARNFYVASYYSEDGKMVPTKIEKLQPSTAALENINDIYWGMTRLLVALGVPMDYMGLKVGTRAFIDKGDEKGLEAYDKRLRRLQYCITYGLKFIFDIELLLSGFDPQDQIWIVKWPTITPQSAETAARIIMNKSQAATYWSNMGVPVELIGGLLDFNPDAIELWKNELKKQVAQQQAIAKSTPPPAKPAPATTPAKSNEPKGTAK